MDTKFYTPAQHHCLTIATHPGNLFESDIEWNIMRMLLMDEGMDAKTAFEILDKLPVDEYRKLRKVAKDWRYDQEMQDYLDRMHIKELMPLQPIPIPMDQALDIMDEFSLKGLYQYEIPQTEWD